MHQQELLDAVENLIDRTSVRQVIEAMAEVCGQKEEHLRTIWQDYYLARKWHRWAYKLHGLV